MKSINIDFIFMKKVDVNEIELIISFDNFVI